MGEKKNKKDKIKGTKYKSDPHKDYRADVTPDEYITSDSEFKAKENFDPGDEGKDEEE